MSPLHAPGQGVIGLTRAPQLLQIGLAAPTRPSQLHPGDVHSPSK